MADTLFNICFLKKFNNYFNRKVIGFETLAEYQNAAEEFFIPNYTISFDPKDNVSTEIITNDCLFDTDYVLILDLEFNILSRWFVMENVFVRAGQKHFMLRRDVIYDNLEELMHSPIYIQKAWLKDGDPFIFNSEGMGFNEIKKDEILLKDDTDSSYIVGYLAKNATPTDINIQTAPVNIPDFIALEDIASDLGISISKLSALINYNDSFDNPSYFANKVELRYGTSSNDLIPYVWKNRVYFNSEFTNTYPTMSELVASWNKTLYKYKTSALNGNRYAIFEAADGAIVKGIIDNKNLVKAGMETIFGRTYLTNTQLSKLQAYLDKTVKYNDKYYKLQLRTNGTVEEVQGPAAYSAFAGFSTGINAAVATSQFTNNATFHSDGEISVRLTSTLCYIQLNDSQIDDTVPMIKTKIPSTRNANQNNSYDLFVIPFNVVKIIKPDATEFYSDTTVAKVVASEIARELDASCYDVQLLPYFPMIDAIKNGAIDLTNLTEDKDFSYITKDMTGYVFKRTITGSQYEINPFLVNHIEYKETLFSGYESNVSYTATVNYISGSEHIVSVAGTQITEINGEIVFISELILDDEQYKDDIEIEIEITFASGTYQTSVIFWLNSDSFSTVINKSLSLKDSLKIENECNKYRICSPNYQGSFDFNVAKNGGVVRNFIAECTYKPYTPYIKVVPQFGLLYGANYGDARGAICGGDFSLSRFTDAWESFELQNKNYQNIFNREIQKLDFEQNLEYRKSLITGGVGILTGGVGGAAAGGMASGSWIGAVVGGVAGTAGSAVGMGLDVDMLVQQQRQNRQFAIDKFNYQLGNIKALPYTLTKIGAFNINSKIWPFLEYYTCTDEEKAALESKLKYESMTVMRIGYFGDFWRVDSELRYFKGELIRNEEIAEDNHIFEAIYGEILKGVYM